MAYELLSEPIRRYVRDKRWESLRPIQGAAIQHIISTDYNFILASRTASGKTEAAFLPILSKVDFREPGVQVLYISPLIALINDQFHRVEELCKYLDVKVTKWHGEANRTEKKKLVQAPEGIVLITPESLEAMFVNAPYSVKALFSKLRYVVIDEIHSFLGTDRGIHLKSILSRLSKVSSSKCCIVGLSATIGDYSEAKRFTGDEYNTKVLLDKTAKEMLTSFRYHQGATVELPLELIKDLYKQTYDHKVLIFPNSRGRAEEIAVKLKRISEKVNGHANYFSHHSSVDKEVREYVEHFAKHNQRQSFCISCTSTLELGIDIGSVDKVVQVDATNSIASLIQRVGRSGRREGGKSQLLLYATDKWSLLQSLACWLLYQEGYIEPVKTAEKPFDLALHQALSIVKETSGCTRKELVSRLRENFAFQAIGEAETHEIIQELVDNDWLELLHRELIIGVEGEKVVNSREFYSVFKSEPSYKVMHSGKAIGEIPLTEQVREDENILLAAKVWKIKYVDFKSKKIEVAPTADGKKPLFLGRGGTVDAKVREKMLQVLLAETVYPEMDEQSQEVITELRKDFAVFPLGNCAVERPVLTKDSEIILYTFTGTKVNRSIAFLLNSLDLTYNYDEHSSSFAFSVALNLLPDLIEQLLLFIDDVDFHLEQAVQENESLLDFSKWGGMLPIKFKTAVLKDRYYDFGAARQLLSSVKLVSNNTPASVSLTA
ncbi:DEAD/DEAH box helicase [Pontibacter diazotrophicus]|uniref:DEAD/DEAH box helicase n=1 Tax=Pontibacter diazotrophicus TaxID=1400979 RepID=A0A3D8L7H6_9BACT|nr:DEAD/DEAH box helicase [Pontibacter diazotrophicus]RDV13324.1 DEAD/DEAH box helicase [Pontibacter diazotrophicus]